MRSYEIFEILELLVQENYISSLKIAEHLGVGEKTLRERIRNMKGMLPEGIAEIEMKYGAGYRLCVKNKAAFASWEKELLEQEKTAIPSSSEERVDYLMLFFLGQKGYVKKESLCGRLYVSEKTLSVDLKKTEYVLKQYGILLDKKAHYGIKAEGKEFAKRQCLMNFYLGRKASRSIVRTAVQEINQVRDAVLHIIRDEKLLFSELSIKYLVHYLYIARQRIHQGFIITEQEYPEADRMLMDMAEGILMGMERDGMAVSMQEPEITYLAIFLKGNRMYSIERSGVSNFVITEDTIQLSAEMLESVNQLYQIDFRDDLNMRMMLDKHLVAMELRLQYGMQVANPILEEVKEKFLLSYLMAQQACIPVAKKYQCKISENEMAYIAMLFEMAREQKKEAVVKKNILLVCATGETSSYFLRLALEKKFEAYIEHIDLCSLYELEKQDMKQYDCIFTTVPINQSVSLPIVFITNFLTQSEISVVKQELDCMENGVLLEFFRPQFFFADVGGENREDVLREMCARIQKQYPLPDGFLASVLRREKLGDTDFGNMTAIPHPEERILEDNLVCVGVLKKPVLWSKNKVQLVILTAVREGMSREVQRYFEVTATLLSREDLVMEIIREPEFSTLCRVLEKITQAEQLDF